MSLEDFNTWTLRTFYILIKNYQVEGEAPFFYDIHIYSLSKSFYPKWLT